MVAIVCVLDPVVAVLWAASFDSGVRPFGFAQGRLSLRMTQLEME